MKPKAFAYAAPTSLTEALRLIADQEDAQLLAGGQSLGPMLYARLATPALLVDLNHVPDLTGLSRLSDGSIRAGAMTRHRTFELDPLVAEALPVVHAAMPNVAHVGIRNRGTIGGSLSLADPAAEWPALCLACEAKMVLASLAGERRVAAEDFSLGMFSTACAPGEILTEVIFPAWPAGRRWAFREVSRRLGDFAIVGIVAIVDLDPEGRCTQARIVAFGAADRPVLLKEAAEILIGRRPSLALVREAARAADTGLEPMSDIHGSADYRRSLVPKLVARTLGEAFDLETRKAA